MQKIKITLVRLLVRLFSWLPLPLLQGVASLVGRCAWAMNGRSAKITRKNLTLCYPQLDEKEIERLGKESLIETTKTMMEMGKAWLSPTAKTLGFIRNVSEELDVDAALAKGNGVIAIVPHFGNWEILNLYAGDRFPLNILYQPPKMAELDDFIRGARERVGTQVFPTDRRGVSAMFQALRKGEVVGILPDMEPPMDAGVFAPFFGQQALTMTLVSKLVQKTGAAVVYAYAKRLPNGAGFEVVIKPADEGIYADDLQESVSALNRSVEACAEASITQYQWEYKRFKQGPEGKTGHYKT